MSEEDATLTLRPIGYVRNGVTDPACLPTQGRLADEPIRGVVELDPRYASALDDVDRFEFVWLLWWLHRARPWKAKVVPHNDNTERGLFATRAPSRPNPIGLTAVRVLGRDGPTLRVEGLDMLDGTPVLDIKPYAPRADAICDAGWPAEKKRPGVRGDDRLRDGGGPDG